MKAYLNERYGNVQVIGTNYPVPAPKMMMARVVIGLLFFGILTSLMGETLCKWFGITHKPEIVTTMTQNKLASCMFIWFVGNLVTSALTSTGAFEISYNGQMIFSKIRTGRMPKVDEIMEAIDNIGVM